MPKKPTARYTDQQLLGLRDQLARVFGIVDSPVARVPGMVDSPDEYCYVFFFFRSIRMRLQSTRINIQITDPAQGPFKIVAWYGDIERRATARHRSIPSTNRRIVERALEVYQEVVFAQRSFALEVKS